MNGTVAICDETHRTLKIHVRGQVQGVGFRPHVWRLAQKFGFQGEVFNDASGVVIIASGRDEALDEFLSTLRDTPLPLCRISSIDYSEIKEGDTQPNGKGFVIGESQKGEVATLITADSAVCQDCLDETMNSFERRFLYPFTNCTHCGPRFSIIKALPYDRVNTSMADFPLCEDCKEEFENPGDRRFHAQPVACHKCGPTTKLVSLKKRSVTYDFQSVTDDVDAVCSLLQNGKIVAIKGIGGFHLSVDATNMKAVERLRARKQRDGKPFALMARDLEVVKAYAFVSPEEEALLTSAAAPIVILQAKEEATLAHSIAPGLSHFGFMLPYTPLHHLILHRMDHPIVMTSANLTNEPQITKNEDALDKLAGLADYALFHNREIVNRVDDSVVKVYGGRAHTLRRARGYAPGYISLPEGFEDAPEILAYGGEVKGSFCCLKGEQAILSQHIGDLEDPLTFQDYQRSIKLYQELFEFSPKLLAADLHPEYLSSKQALDRSTSEELPLTQVQHHHAHIASVMAEHGLPLDTKPVLGIALDGVGFGDDDTIWGGEFLLATYCDYKRLGCFKPVAMIGGAKAIQQPWRNIYAHLMAEMGWDHFAMNFNELELFDFLDKQPREIIDRMLEHGTNVPLASSCGRLFDAVAASLGLAREHASFEGQGAIALEAIVDEATLLSHEKESFYPFTLATLKSNGLPFIEPLSMWHALLGDLILKTPKPIIAARFHKGLANALIMMVRGLIKNLKGQGTLIQDVILTGGCFQNAILFELVKEPLEATNLKVHSGETVPINDGGLALGQAAISAARYIETRRT